MPTDEEMLQKAAEARRRAYAPYSHFTVGAALLTKSGKLFTGCNIESASYSPSNCAERTAFFKAVSEGERSFVQIAVAGGQEHEEPSEECPPCGVCRQVMMEFCDPDTFRIILAGSGGSPHAFKLKELLPRGFGPKNLK
ncbi:MAG TPA: cytidine deaminase [Ruminococcaceae bacterium]|jgi:cytidine deaminase|nr:cytidine deaminase [Oscillospiraceae bacterium]